MKRILSALLALSAAMAVADGSPFSVSGSSGEFVVDTRPEIGVTDVTSDYCSGRYGGHGGRVATFLAGVHCDIEFKIKAELREGRKPSYYLVNGTRTYGESFTLDVGDLAPFSFVRVVAVNAAGKHSDPFRVNIEIAPLPPKLQTDVRMGRVIFADKCPREGRVVYRTADFSPFALLDPVKEQAEIGGEIYDFEWAPQVDLSDTMDSSTGEYCFGADVGMGANSEKEFDNAAARLGLLNVFFGLSGGTSRNYDPRRGVWTLGYNELGIKLSGEAKVRQRVPQFPLIYGEIALLSDASITAHQEDDEWRADVALDPLVALKATVGVGSDPIVAAEVSGQGGLHLTGSIPGGIDRVYLNGKFFWKAVFATHSRSGVWWEKDLELYPGDPQAGSVDDGGGAGGGGGGGLRQVKAIVGAAAASGARSTDSGWVPLPRNYGGGAPDAVSATPAVSSKFADVARFSGATDRRTVLMAAGYPIPQPSIAASGAGAALAYIRDKASRADLDRTLLVVRDEEDGGEWGAESAVWDDGTADFQPKLAFLPDGLAVAAWANAKRTFADGTSFENVCSSLEVAVGVRDPQTGAWTSRNLTDDESLDWTPVLKSADNGTAAVAWVRNAAGAYIGSASQPSELAVSFYRNGAWSPMDIVVPAVGAVLSHDIAWDGDKAVLVWAADADGDLSTDDSEIWAKSLEKGAWGTPVRLCAPAARAVRPYAWFGDSGAIHVVWAENEGFFHADTLEDGSGSSLAMPDEVRAPADFRLLRRDGEHATLYWVDDLASSASAIEGAVVAASFSPSAGLAEPIPLRRENGRRVRNPSLAVRNDDSVRVSYESVAVSHDAEGRLVSGDVDLCVWSCGATADVGVRVEDCALGAVPTIGGTNSVGVVVRNGAAVPVSGVAYRIWAGTGEEKTLLSSGQVDISSFSGTKVVVPWIPREGLADVAFTVEIDPDAVLADADRTNNTLLWRPDVGSPAISFRNAAAVRATDTLRLVSVRLHNDSVSPLPAGTVVKFWRGEIGGALIGTDVAGLVGGAGDYDVGIAWDVSRATFTSAWERVVIELPAELGGRSVSVWTTTPLYEDEDDDPSGGGGGSGGTSEGGPSAPPDIGGTVGFATAGGESVFRFSFHGEAGFTYLVQYKNRLDDPAWITVLAVTPSETGDCPISVPVEDNEPSRFYRIVLE